MALITPKGVIAIIVRSPQLINPTSVYMLGKPWSALMGEGWTSKPATVMLIDSETLEVLP
jgi:hypothetical protein